MHAGAMVDYSDDCAKDTSKAGINLSTSTVHRTQKPVGAISSHVPWSSSNWKPNVKVNVCTSSDRAYVMMFYGIRKGWL